VALVQRDDDQPDAIANRLKVYEEQTAPLIGYYEAAGKLARIDGQRSPDVVGQELLETVKV
jgi:adenylate kinase